MLDLKITILIALCVVPFVYVQSLRRRTKTIRFFRSIIAKILNKLVLFKIIYFNACVLRIRFFNGMTRSDNFRKFYVRILLLFIIAIQFIDFHASNLVLNMEKEHVADFQILNEISQTYGLFMTRPSTTLLAAIIGFSLFFFKAADWILTTLHNSQKTFYFTAFSVLIILFYSTQYLIVSETIYVIILAAYFYPNKTGRIIPNGGVRLPDNLRQQSMKMAA